ncbi:MAG: family 20 glycosylhydrolase, partial [Melioribacteraceae bacterium]
QIIHSTSISQSNKSSIHIPAYTIVDEPRFGWRGMLLDVSRHFFDIEFVKKYLDIMAMYKLNVFHWHLTDDQGWRIEIKKHPKLTEVGAWRKGTGKEKWDYQIEAVVDGDPKYGGFYTQEEIKEIIQYAKERYITVIPEIELPGHSWSALNAYPELSCTGTPWIRPEETPWEFTDPFCPGNEKTFEFFENIFSEVIDLFPSKYIHIGGDEAKKTPWTKCEKCQLRMQAHNLENVDELQSYFVKRIQKIVNSKGRKIIGWDEILEGGLAPGAAVMSWRGEEGGIEAATHKHNVVMTPGDFVYFNKPQFDAKLEDAGYNILPLEKIYSYNPIPKELEKENHKYILGAEALLWSEYLYSYEIAENRLTPRIAALSEVVWTSKENKNWKNFQNKLTNHFSFLDEKNVNYFIPPPTNIENDLFVKDDYKVEMNKSYTNSEIYYTMDNSEPTKNSIKYDKPFIISNSVIIKAKTFMLSNRSSKTVTARINKTAYQKNKMIDNLQVGIQAKYFTGNISSVNDFDNMEFQNVIMLNNFTIPTNIEKDFFGIEFDGYIKILEDGIYTFYLSSDDGSKLIINDKLVIDNDGIHGMIEVKNKVALSKGYHSIKLIYFDNKFGEGLEVNVSSAKMEKQIVPSSMLYHKN